ncbi:hypothetical protein FRB99_005032 [Tulasnella sp. 403]|nr:hypothetical protein FRB99_005032 [Tulasnella sp. 403]
MSLVAKALPELYSESVEARIYAVATRDYEGNNEPGPPGFYPQYAELGDASHHSYHFTPARFWASGFFPGSMWLLYERSKRFGVSSRHVSPEEWRMLARQWTIPIAEQADRTDTHDMGFLFMTSWYKYARLDPQGTNEARKVLIQAATSLASRFNPTVGCLRSWDQSWHLANGVKRGDMDKHFLVIIDGMMNLDLLYSVQYFLHGQPRTLPFSSIAITHGLTTIENHFHSDGGTYHVLNYVQSLGVEEKVIKRWSAQGYADDSVWARGQAWAIYGFARSAEWTDILARQERATDGVILGAGGLEGVAEPTVPFAGRMEFVNQAKIAADYFVRNLGEGKAMVPPWDFDCPNDADGSLTYREVSAGMIAASGMLTLHVILARTQPQTKSPYLGHALDIVRATIKYCSNPPASFIRRGFTKQVNLGEGHWDTILNRATTNYQANATSKSVGCGFVYADYYFIEVGNKLLEMERRGLIKKEDLQ